MPSLSTGLHNSAQVLRGARRPATIKTYVTGGVTRRPTAVYLHDTASLTAGYDVDPGAVARAHIISIVGGAIEFDGREVSLDTEENGNHIDLDLLANMLCAANPDCPEYYVAAVPRYDMPSTKQEAKALGVNYTVQLTSTGEWTLRYFLGSECEAMTCGGSMAELEKKILNDCITCEERRAYYKCKAAMDKMGDPSCRPSMLCIRGVSFVLLDTCPQNTYCCDTIGGLSDCEFKALMATIGDTKSIFLEPIDTGTDAVTTSGYYTIEIGGTGEFYTSNSSYHNNVGSNYGDGNGPGTKLAKIKSLTVYPDIASAQACIGGQTIMYPETQEDIDKQLRIFTTPLPDDPCATPCGLGWDPTTMVATAQEYELCCSLPYDRQGDKPEIRRTLTKRDADLPFMGIINPIYNTGSNVSLRFPHASTSSPMTFYADPVPLFKFSLSNVDTTIDPPEVTIDPNSLEYEFGYLFDGAVSNP